MALCHHPKLLRAFAAGAMLLAAFSLRQAVAADTRSGASLPVVYNNITESSDAPGPSAKAVYAGRFRIVDVTRARGFTPARSKGARWSVFSDPRPTRQQAVPAKVGLSYIVSADGRIVEPRVHGPTDKRLADYVTRGFTLQRFVPARLNGTPVATLQAAEFEFGPKRNMGEEFFQNGLGIQGSRDR